MDTPCFRRAVVTDASAVAFMLALMVFAQSVCSDNLDLFDIPPYIAPTVSPNLVVSIDNADSLFRAFAPATLGLKENQELHAAKSSHYNRLYYNPDRYYPPPRDLKGNLLPNADFFAVSDEVAVFNLEHFPPDLRQSSTRKKSRNLASDYMPRWAESENDRFPAFAPDTSDDTRKGVAYYYSYEPEINPFLCQAHLSDNEIHKTPNNACYRFVAVAENSGPLRNRPELGGRHSRDERTNFANWYQYYSTKIRVAKTLLSHWLSSGQTAASTRLARQSLTSASPQSGDVSAPHVTVRSFDDSQREQFFRWLDALSPSLQQDVNVHDLVRQSGEFFASTGRVSPYREQPWKPEQSGTEASCRVNYHLLVTDGLSNHIDDDSSPENQDHLALRLPDETRYSPLGQPLYSDRQNATLADWSFHFWSTDLRPDLHDNVTPLVSREEETNRSYWQVQYDPARWQHMVNHVLLIGEQGLIPENSSVVLGQLQRGFAFHNFNKEVQQGWTVFGDNPTNDPARMDDLFHSSLNSRGRFYIWPATRDESDSSSGGGIFNQGTTLAPMRYLLSDTFANTTRTIAGNVLYQAQMDGRAESGHLLALPLDENGSNPFLSEPYWDVHDVNRQRRAQDKLIIGFDPRKSLGERGMKVSGTDRDFNFYLQQRLTEQPEFVQQLLAYIAGAQSQEKRLGGVFRNREDAVLGTIVNSAPHYVGRSSHWYPDDLERRGQAHREFVCVAPLDENGDGRIDQCASGIFNRRPMVYVGSNDGMLHAYDARAAGGGSELFSYLPDLMIPQLKRIANPDWPQVAGVDGPLSSTDVFYGGQWHTVLVGGLRTGGQGYFALDITDPESVDPNHAVQLARWEFGDQQDVDQGYSYSMPVIAKSNYQTGDSNGRWVAVWGNGYNSRVQDGRVGSGEAVLFIVDIETGEMIKKIRTGAGNVESQNGLSSPAVVDNNDDFKADYVYAGDLQGNLWKFDISSANPDAWQVAYGEHLSAQNSPRYVAKPLFKAQLDGRAQAITAAPMLSHHPDGKGGLLVYFGTGAYLEKSAQGDLSQQSFYAIWDRNYCRHNDEAVDCSTIDVPLHPVYETFNRSDLQAQHLSLVQSNRRSVSHYPVDWETQRGWFVDFPEPGERVIGQAQLQGNLVLFSTLVPSGDSCREGAHSWLMALDKASGANPASAPFSDRDNEAPYSAQTQRSGGSAGLKQSSPQPIILQKVCGDGVCLLGDALEQLEDGTRLGRRRWQVLQE